MKDEQTSSEVASEASKLMRDSNPAVRRVAASALNQAPDKKKYVAQTGINFEGLKGKPRVEAGQHIPEGLKPEQIEALLDIKAIKEVEK